MKTTPPRIERAQRVHVQVPTDATGRRWQTIATITAAGADRCRAQYAQRERVEGEHYRFKAAR